MGGSGVDAGAVSERRMSVDPAVRSTERRPLWRWWQPTMRLSTPPPSWNPNAGSARKPRVARSPALPWVRVAESQQPQRGCAEATSGHLAPHRPSCEAPPSRQIGQRPSAMGSVLTVFVPSAGRTLKTVTALTPRGKTVNALRPLPQFLIPNSQFLIAPIPLTRQKLPLTPHPARLSILRICKR